MEVRDLTVGIAVQLDYAARDIGYGVESGEGVFLYRGRDQTGKYVFVDCRDGEMLYLFEDEVLAVEEVERQLFTVCVEAFRRPTVATWQRWAFSEDQAEREAIEAGEREWPDAVVVRASIQGAAMA